MNTSCSQHTAWKHVGRAQNRKLWDKLYTDASSHEKICMGTRPCKSKSSAERRFFHSEYTSQSFAWAKPMISDMISYVKSCIRTRPRMWEFAPGDVFVSQNSANKRLLVKIADCHVSQLIQLVESRRIRRSNGKLCWKLHTDMGSCVKICTRTWPS